MSINDRLNELLNANQNKRLAEEKAREKKRDNPKILRHTTYQGDRKIQQLGDEVIENGVVLNNQSIAIGDAVLPLAKGNVLRRVDNTNGGKLLGSALRGAKEDDLDVNGNNNQFGGGGITKVPTGGGGGGGGAGGRGGKLPTKSPSPSGCQPPPPTCVWSVDPTPPQGWQSMGSVTTSEKTLNLYCLAGTSVAPDLGCDFLMPPPPPFCGGTGTWTFEFFFGGVWNPTSIAGGASETFSQTTVPSTFCQTNFGIPNVHVVIGSCFPENALEIFCANAPLLTRNFVFTPD